MHFLFYFICFCYLELDRSFFLSTCNWRNLRGGGLRDAILCCLTALDTTFSLLKKDSPLFPHHPFWLLCSFSIPAFFCCLPCRRQSCGAWRQAPRSVNTFSTAMYFYCYLSNRCQWLTTQLEAYFHFYLLAIRSILLAATHLYCVLKLLISENWPCYVL